MVTVVIGATAAQSQNADIARCSREKPAEQRIHCLEDAIRRLAGDVPNTNTDPSDPIEAAPIASETGAGEPQVADAEPRVTDTEPQVADAEPQVADTEPQVADTEPQVADTEPQATPTLESFGEEQIARRAEREDHSGERIKATVVAFEFVGRNKLRARLDNGQVWRQSDSDRANLYRALRNTDSFEVEMWKTRSDSYRMYVPIARTTMVVTRTR